MLLLWITILNWQQSSRKSIFSDKSSFRISNEIWDGNRYFQFHSRELDI